MNIEKSSLAPGAEELRSARKESRKLYWTVGLFSAFANLLMLTGPLYMLQVYDRVLGSRSVETLVALTILVAFLYGVMGILDYFRGRLLARIGARFQEKLDHRVFDAVTKIPSKINGQQISLTRKFRQYTLAQMSTWGGMKTGQVHIAVKICDRNEWVDYLPRLAQSMLQKTLCAFRFSCHDLG